MKILRINEEWQIAVDKNGNYMPERYVIKSGGDLVAGKVAKPFEGWERQKDVFLPSANQAAVWIATKVNHEGASQHILDSLKDINERLGDIMAKIKEQTK